MGVINGSSLSLCMIKSSTDEFCFSSSLNKNGCAIARYQSKFICMASSSASGGVKQQVKLTGDSFIRPHLRELSPYQPILPFEVIEFTRSDIHLQFLFFHMPNFHFWMLQLGSPYAENKNLLRITECESGFNYCTLYYIN